MTTRKSIDLWVLRTSNKDKEASLGDKSTEIYQTPSKTRIGHEKINK